MFVRQATDSDVAALIALDSVAEHEPQRAAQIRAWCGQGSAILPRNRTW